VRFFDFSPVKLAAYLRPPSRANYRSNNGLLKGRNNATRIMDFTHNVQSVSSQKWTFKPFQPPCWNCV